jgi:hypothetical protein
VAQRAENRQGDEAGSSRHDGDPIQERRVEERRVEERRVEERRE